jgi:hypothetical protein
VGRLEDQGEGTLELVDALEERGAVASKHKKRPRMSQSTSAAQDICIISFHRFLMTHLLNQLAEALLLGLILVVEVLDQLGDGLSISLADENVALALKELLELAANITQL